MKKMVHLRLFTTIAIIILLLGSCGQKKKSNIPPSVMPTHEVQAPKEQDKSSDPLTIDSGKVNKYYISTELNKDNADSEINPCTEISISIFFPTNNKAIKDSIFARQKEFIADQLQSIGRRKELTEKECEQLTKEKDWLPLSIAMFKSPIIFDSKKAATVSYTYYTYGTGAAHGWSAITPITYNKRTGQKVKEYDLIRADKMDEYEKVFNKHFKLLRKKYDNTFFDTSDNAFDSRPEVYLTNKGLSYRYQEYELGPYSIGLPELIIPYQEVNDLLQADAPIQPYT